MKTRKKKLGIAAVVIAVLIALLEARPHIIAAINGDTEGLAEYSKSKLLELQDAGTFTE